MPSTTTGSPPVERPDSSQSASTFNSQTSPSESTDRMDWGSDRRTSESLSSLSSRNTARLSSLDLPVAGRQTSTFLGTEPSTGGHKRGQEWSQEELKVLWEELCPYRYDFGCGPWSLPIPESMWRLVNRNQLGKGKLHLENVVRMFVEDMNEDDVKSRYKLVGRFKRLQLRPHRNIGTFDMRAKTAMQDSWDVITRWFYNIITNAKKGVFKVKPIGDFIKEDLDAKIEARKSSDASNCIVVDSAIGHWVDAELRRLP